MAKAKVGKKAKKWLIGIGIGVLVLLCGGLAVRCATKDNPERVSATFGYERGSVSTTDGSELSGTTSIRTKELISVEELVCDYDEKDALITYQIFYYDEDEEFLSVSEVLNADYNAEDVDLPEGATYARIVITPTSDSEITASEVSDYAGELTVEYKK